jgi:hypothetical protein
MVRRECSTRLKSTPGMRGCPLGLGGHRDQPVDSPHAGVCLYCSNPGSLRRDALPARGGVPDQRQPVDHHERSTATRRLPEHSGLTFTHTSGNGVSDQGVLPQAVLSSTPRTRGCAQHCRIDRRTLATHSPHARVYPHAATGRHGAHHPLPAGGCALILQSRIRLLRIHSPQAGGVSLLALAVMGAVELPFPTYGGCA